MPGIPLDPGDTVVRKRGSFHGTYSGSIENKQGHCRGIHTIKDVKQSMMWASSMGEGAKERLL